MTTDTACFTPLWRSIDARRRARGWTWAELGRRSGVPPALINRWKRKPANATSIRKIAVGFELDDAEQHELLKLGGKAPPKRITSSLTKVEEAIRGEPAFNKQQKEALIAMAHALVATEDQPNDVAHN